MNAEVMQNRWSQLRSEAQQRWNKLTDEDLETSRGQFDRLVDSVAERYGYSRQKAEQQVDRFMQQYGSSMEEMQRTANARLASVRDFASQKPWAVVLVAVLLIGLVAGLIARPNMRNDRVS